jgi:hypothetical protein
MHKIVYPDIILNYSCSILYLTKYLRKKNILLYDFSQ